jgi:hypothetical protein
MENFNEDSGHGIMHSLEKQMTGSRYVNTNGTPLVHSGTQVLQSGILFNKNTESSKKDSG